MAHFEGIVQVNGVDLYVRQAGHGPRLLVIHGGPDWDHSYLREYMSPLEKYAEVVFFDMRGCGRSQRLINLCDLHVSHVVEDVRQLMSYFGSEPWAVLGFSFGGRVGLEMVSQYPELVTRFILASSTAYPAVPGGRFCLKELNHFRTMLRCGIGHWLVLIGMCGEILRAREPVKSSVGWNSRPSG